jgi:hypothetical protein
VEASVPLMLNLPPDLEQALRERAAGRGIDVGALILQAIRSELRQTCPAEGTNGASGDDDEPEAVWRGVFTLQPARHELFLTTVEARTATTPRWQPTVQLDPRWFVNDDE